MNDLPDVTSDLNAENPLTLQWVGMENIAVPVTMSMLDDKHQNMTAKANVYVSLEKPSAKGIHMSRLHKVINLWQRLNVNKKVSNIYLMKLFCLKRELALEPN